MKTRNIVLLAMSCIILGGCITPKRDNSTPTPTGGSAHETLDPPSSDESDRQAYERWKSCVDFLYPQGVLLITDLQQLFQQPQNVQQLLRNLRLAQEKDLLLQPSFFDPAILQKFFSGSNVVRKEPRNPLTQDVGFILSELDSNVIKGMTVRVESRCWQMNAKAASGQMESTAYHLGYLTISGGPFAGITLRAIRGVFGPETVNHIDGATVEFGIVHAPETKGSLIYTDRAKEKAEGGLGLGTTFVVPLQSHRELGAPLTLVDDDFVEGIRMEEASHRLLEK